MQFDRSYTDGEVKALIAPMFGLTLDDVFDVTIIVSSGDSQSAITTAESWAVLGTAI